MLSRRSFLAAFAVAKVRITAVDIYPIRLPATKDEAARELAAELRARV